MKKISPLIARVALVTGLGLGAFALSAIAGSWTAPTVAPPNGNVDAPINVGGAAPGPVYSQVKTGLLGLSNLMVTKLNTAENTVSANQVLTALDSNGTVGWRTPSSSSSQNCGADGYMYSIPDAGIDDWGMNWNGDRLEFYCRSNVVRLCLSGESNCPWRTNIASNDTDTCAYGGTSYPNLASGANGNISWQSAPPSLWLNGVATPNTMANFNPNGNVMAYAIGTNTWFLCTSSGGVKTKTIIRQPI